MITFYYEINICKRGRVHTHICKNTKEKNKWLVHFFTRGNGYAWGEQQFRNADNPKKLPFEKYIHFIIKNKTQFILDDNTLILVRKKPTLP